MSEIGDMIEEGHVCAACGGFQGEARDLGAEPSCRCDAGRVHGIPWVESEPIDQLDGTYATVETALVDGVYLTWMDDRVHGVTEDGNEDERPCSIERRDLEARELIAEVKRWKRAPGC